MNLPLNLLMTIGGVPIFTGWGGQYVAFISDLDVCTDGTGPSHGDDYHLNQTAYTPSLNADVDPYVVVPPQIRMKVPPVVMGCLARVTNLRLPHLWGWGVMGEIGPDTKTGECAICLAQHLNPTVSANSGDSNHIYLYELWPGRAAVVNGKTYKLIPAG
jgi:hypothetical protein